MERWRGRPQNAPKVRIFISIKIAHNLKEFWLAELYLWNFRGRPVNLVCPTSQLEGYSLARVSFQLLWWGWGFFWMMMRFCKMSRLRLIFDDQILVQQLCNSMRCKYTLGAASKADVVQPLSDNLAYTAQWVISFWRIAICWWLDSSAYQGWVVQVSWNTCSINPQSGVNIIPWSRSLMICVLLIIFAQDVKMTSLWSN